MKKIHPLIITAILFISFFSSGLFAQQSKDWSIVASYSIPGKASGLAWDGTYIYFGIYGADGDKVFRFDPSNSNTTLLFSNPAIDDSYGMTYDGQDLWIIDQPASSLNPALATKLDFSGNILSTITLPDHYMSGIAHDAGDFWVGTYYPDPGVIYQVNNAGSVQNQFGPPAAQTWDLCLQDNDLWVADYYAHMLFRVDQSGSILESHPCENTKPSGIVFDGSYLWYCDGELSSASTLYKVDLGGVGTPAINLPLNRWDYGIVTIGSSESWAMQVQNTGTADLTITGLIIQNAVPIFTTFTTPKVVAPGNSTYIVLEYAPTEPGPLNTTVTVESDDPINPQVDAYLTGNAVNPGPSIIVTQTIHDYGLIRMNAYKRWFLEIHNIGDEVLSIASISSSSDRFIVDDAFAFPIEITTLDSALIGIWFNPDEGAYFSGTLEVVCNDPSQTTITIDLEGEGNDQTWPMGEVLWYYNINTSWDNTPKAISAIPDITGDGVDDVIACSEDNYIRCFNGNGSGEADIMWEQFVYSGDVAYQNGLDIMPDINNDGYDDLVVGTGGGDRSVIALSGKTGMVIWKYETNEYGDGGTVYQVDCIYDYNDDGVLDVLAATGNDGQGSSTGPKRIFCLDGMNGDKIWECHTNGPNFSVIGIRDFNGDGVPDVLGGASTLNETQGKVYGIDGAGGSIEWTYDTDGSSVWALGQTFDINGKGVEDIVAGDFGGNYYFLDAENGDYLNSGSLGPSIILQFSKLDDVNNDGHPDFVPGYSGSNARTFSGLDGSTIWVYPVADLAFHVARIGDVTGDGINDVLIGTLFNNNYCYFRDGVDGSELWSINYGEPVDGINSIPDINNDGSMEMVAGGRQGKLTCYSGGLNAMTGTIENGNIDDPGLVSSIYPNPCADVTHLRYLILDSGSLGSVRDRHLISDLFDISGRKIQRICEEEKLPGEYEVEVDVSELPAGVYFVKMQAGNDIAVRKLIVR